MKRFTKKSCLTNAFCLVILALAAATCTPLEFDNPLDKDGEAYQCDDWFVNGCEAADPQTRTLTTNANPSAGGVVEPAGTTAHDAGTEVTVTAAAAEGHVFSGWTGAPETVDAASETITFEMDRNITLIANFRLEDIETPVVYTLTTIIDPEDGGAVITRDPDLETYEPGTMVTVSIASDNGLFVNWTGDLISAERSITFAVNSNVTLTANIVRIDNVSIGGRTWMKKNLNFRTDGSWCYDNDDSNCEKFGRLYTWDAAMNACPAGWRLPTDDDWNNLINAVGGNLGSSAGFSALPGGSRWGDVFHGINSSYWWSATTDGANARYWFTFGGNVLSNSTDKNNAFSVRCVVRD